MKKLIEHKDIVTTLSIANIDTDAIIPKQFLQKITRSGFGQHLFHDWRYIDEAGEKENPEFILNKEPYRKSSILLTQENFGCGSSREHAPWALSDFGIKVIIAPSFADIFYNNCFNNSILAVKLPQSEIDELFALTKSNPQELLHVDLRTMQINFAEKTYSFSLNNYKRKCLIEGLDSIGATLANIKEIENFEKNIPTFYQ